MKLPLQYSTEPRQRRKWPLIVTSGLAITVLAWILIEPIAYPILHWRVPFLRKQSLALNWIGAQSSAAYFEGSAGNNLSVSIKPSVLQNYWYPEWGFQLVDQADNLLFLHGRRASGKSVRLVCLRVGNFFGIRNGQTIGGFAPSATPGLECSIVQTASLFSPPKILKHFWWSHPALGGKTPKPATIYFGVPDPLDDSKFSILFQTPTEADVIHGQLMPDDTLQFQVLAAPNSMMPKIPATQAN